MALTPRKLSALRHESAGEAGNRLAAAMRLAELTQSELADRIGLTQPYISAVATGRHSTITVENAHKFAEFFGCSIEDLFPAKSEVA